MKDTKQHILDIAFGLFLQKSFKEVTMAEIVSKTGLSKGAFYHYFVSKENLFEEVIGHYFNILLKTGLSDTQNLTLKEYYKQRANNINLFESKVALSDTKSAFSMNFYFLIFDALKLFPDFRKKLDDHQKKELATWSSVIRRAKKTGEIKSKLSDKHIASIFNYTGDGVALNLMLDNKPQNLKKDILGLWNAIYDNLK